MKTFRMSAASQLATIFLLAALTACSDSRSSASSEMAEHEAKHDEHEAHAAGVPERVALDAEQIQRAEIGLAQAGPANIREVMTVYGTVVPNAERVREVGARFQGVIRSVAKSVGEPVRQGETLAVIESNESLQTYAVVSPLAGIVTARNANPGEQTSDKALFTVADLSKVWVELSIFPRDIAKIRVGQTAQIKSADTGLSAEGLVIYVAPFGSSRNQTLTARVLLDNPERQWPPGLYVTAEVLLTSVAVPIAIDAKGLQTVDEKTVVFVKNAGAFEPRPVQVGRSDGELAEVVTGIEPGATYATDNSFILKAELGKGEAAHED